MNIERRITSLEEVVDSLVKKLNNDKFYEDADKAGMNQIRANGDDDNASKIDYLAMMTHVDIPTEDEEV